jgi:hypothetical protein
VGFYNTQHATRFKAVTPYSAGNDDNKVHGFKITALVTVVDKDFYGDLGYGEEGKKYINALLGGEIPCQNRFDLKYSHKEGLFLNIEDSKLRVPCSVDNIETTPILVDHWDVELKIKCPELTDVQAGRLSKLLNTLVYLRVETTQETMLSDEVEITVEPRMAPLQEEASTPSIFDANVGSEVTVTEDDPTDRGLTGAAHHPRKKKATKKAKPAKKGKRQ